jgi:hypothetical protein
MSTNENVSQSRSARLQSYVDNHIASHITLLSLGQKFKFAGATDNEAAEYLEQAKTRLGEQSESPSQSSDAVRQRAASAEAEGSDGEERPINKGKRPEQGRSAADEEAWSSQTLG